MPQASTMTTTPFPPDARETDLTVYALIPEYRLAITRDAKSSVQRDAQHARNQGR